MRVLVAPDSFGTGLPAVDAAAVLARGWRRGAADDEMRSLPLSDGSTGLVAAVHAAVGGDRLPAVVTGPRGEPMPAELLVVPGERDRSGVRTAYVEAAQACGRHLVPGTGWDPAAGTTAGVGDLLRQAVASGAGRVVVGVGGLGVVDGGAGMLAALEAAPAELLTGGAHRLGRVHGEQLLRLPGGLDRLDGLDGVELVLASDVDAPLLGQHGAALGEARDLGVAGDAAARLERLLTTWADAVAGGRPGLPAAAGAGAGGGLGVALLALGARRVPGAQEVADAVGLGAALPGADLVVTGEAVLDWSSLRGSVLAAVAREAQRAAVPVVGIAGRVLVGRRELSSAGVDAAYAVMRQVGPDLPDEELRGALAARAARVARTWSPSGDVARRSGRGE